jgi:ribose 5-phosphate isomerase A
MDQPAAKRAAGEAAAALVPDGCTVGLGTGSTAVLFVEALGRRVREGLRLSAVATSESTRRLAMSLDIPVIDPPANGIDLAVDGADEVDVALRLVKGAGGAMLRERIVAASAQRFVVVVDETKVRDRLSGHVPVELLEFGAARTLTLLARMGGDYTLRRDTWGRLVRSDNGNLLADGEFAEIADADALAAQLDATPGVVGHGLFLGMTDLLLIGHDDGSVREMAPQR